MDFLGVNTYSCHRIGVEKTESLNDLESFIEDLLKGLLEGEEAVEGREYSEMGWEIYPRALYDLLLRIDKDYNHPLLYITENGMACKDDKIIDRVVQDNDRLNYLKRHFEAAYKAIGEGVNLAGYFVWSFMDNFEWIQGYSKRFGLIRVNYETQERMWKKSALWYKNVINNNGFEEY